MFQTVGHQVIGAIAQAMQVPMLRRHFSGIAKHTELEYHLSMSKNDGDEVEDLYLLLEQVKQQFPQVQAVACGAIFSDYQRNRVENVCSRLGLVSLAYLWRRNQTELLQEMINNQVVAILIKTAGMGLFPQKICGKTLAQVQPLLEKLVHCNFVVIFHCRRINAVSMFVEKAVNMSR